MFNPQKIRKCEKYVQGMNSSKKGALGAQLVFKGEKSENEEEIRSMGLCLS